MPHFFTRLCAAVFALIFTLSISQFSAENSLTADRLFGIAFSCDIVTGAGCGNGQPVQTPTGNSAGGGGNSGQSQDNEITTDSTLGKAQAALTAQEMRGYQSLYEMQAELFAECVAKLKSWDGVLRDPETNKPAGEETEWPAGAVTDLDKICAEEFIEMNEQGPQRLLLPDASGEQPPNNQSENWWNNVLTYWFGEGGLLPELKQTYTETLRSVTAPAAGPENEDLKKALENWYGAANSLGGNEFLWHYLTKKSLHAVPFQQGIVTISNCPNPSAPIFANQDCVKREWKERTEQLGNQRVRLIQKIGGQLKDTEARNNAKELIAWYAVDDTDVISNKDYGLKEIDAKRNPLQLDIQKLSFLVGLLEQLAKYSATVAYQLELKDSSGGMGIYGNFSTTNAGVDIAQITNLSGKENMTLSQTISKLSNTMVIIGLAIMIPIIVYAGFLMVLSGYDYEQYEKGNEMLWKVLPWAVFLCACRLLVAAWLHVLSEAFRPIASF